MAELRIPTWGEERIANELKLKLLNQGLRFARCRISGTGSIAVGRGPEFSNG